MSTSFVSTQRYRDCKLNGYQGISCFYFFLHIDQVGNRDLRVLFINSFFSSPGFASSQEIGFIPHHNFMFLNVSFCLGRALTYLFLYFFQEARMNNYIIYFLYRCPTQKMCICSLISSQFSLEANLINGNPIFSLLVHLNVTF